ncbi:MAG: glycerophosphodiester phosphodiesterase family protein [Maricaulaceae bacterium]
MKIPSLIFIVFTLVLFGFYNYLLSSLQVENVNYSKLEDAVLISHAGSGLDVGTYSNSKESLDQAAAYGYKYIEVDLNQTQNGDWVLIHDWNKNYFKYFIHFPQFPKYFFAHEHSLPKTALEFQNRKMRYNLTPMTLENLTDWLKKHPDVKIITDVKGSNYQCLETIKSMMDGRTDQIIPQIYAPEEHQDIKALGYENIILTVYNLRLNVETLAQLADFSQANDLFAITVPQRWINQDIDTWRPDAGTHLFTHTINNTAKAEHFKTLGVLGFYTDYIIPPQETEHLNKDE